MHAAKTTLTFSQLISQFLVQCRSIRNKEHGEISMHKHKCTLSFKSFKFVYIKNSVNRIYQMLSFFKLPIYSAAFVSQPTRRKKYTVLCSPHIDKKSREQFELVKKKGELVVYFTKNHFLLFLLFWLRNSQFPGVQIRVTLNQSTNYTRF